ncbi:MAG: JmjC domain-containing protein [bacterium]
MPSFPLGDLTPDYFLSHFWQKKPLLIRQAFPDFCVDITPEELAGVTCDTDVPSRIIAENGLLGDQPQSWQVKHGAFEEADFTCLPETHWTLLVNDLERYYPELQTDILQHFRFIPDWRIDDLMLSFAVAGGSVGAHTDEYDVFLLQAAGQREWRVSSLPVTVTEAALIPEIELKILREFTPDETWVLNPGDMLYVPPHVIHHGVALNDCMTFSVGFRAPDQQALLGMYLDKWGAQSQISQDSSVLNPTLMVDGVVAQSPNTRVYHKPNVRYTDTGLSYQTQAGELRREQLDALTRLLKQGLEQPQAILDRWLGEYLTEVKGEEVAVWVDTPEQVSHAIQITYQQNQNYQRTTSSRFAYTRYPDYVIFFVNGESKTGSPALMSGLDYLCDNYHYAAETLALHIGNDEFLALFNHLLTVQAIQALSGYEDENL